ncbi:MAG: hypothetical protein PHN37_02755, partial [Candidatus Pacebacteria bacterium]|nr:hypothetical protein [Candidatus Paceibacterota bacterium]
MPSTQDFLPIKEIKDGIIILKNGGLRTILAVSSLNFALKSQEEQDAIIYQFQNFLNSLDFSCQISLQSRKLNIVGYLDKIKEIEQNETNELLKVQVSEYGKFIKKIMEGGTIMQKNFFVTVPLSSLEIKSKKDKEEQTDEKFQRNKAQLLQRTEFVILGLRGCGLQAIPLKSLEIIELLWSLHHV